MSLCSLRKSQPSVKPVRLSVDDFIDQATDYAQGRRSTFAIVRTESQVAETNAANSALSTTMKHATFSLSETAIDHLNVLSSRTGVSKSRLLRILIDEQIKQASDHTIENSKVT
ncbi:replication protein RepA [Alteromonas ponticola]|uniref:Replication protein RepA n=1 Tax=Alteromonas ponticola TaxID=2720613 RepID=A0ABX1R2C7_9ALTE|nr:replication protein RepA [Alteromonas ponticola]NMH59227.1 replication protein RepA [Alteromonas ponticola]